MFYKKKYGPVNLIYNTTEENIGHIMQDNKSAITLFSNIENRVQIWSILHSSQTIRWQTYFRVSNKH